MAESGFTRMIIASNTREMASVQQAILDAVHEADFSERAVFAIRLAMEEALSNAIHHGNHDDPDKHVTVDYRVTADRLTVSIDDEGAGFQPQRLADPRAAPNLTHPHGRGVLLMQAYMDEVRFNQSGNAVTLVKYRDENSS